MKKLMVGMLVLAVSVSASCFAAEEATPKADESAAKSVASAKLPVLAGFGNITLDGLLQVWFVHDPTTEFSKGTTDSSTFRLRRGDVKISGDIVPEMGFNMMFDIAKAIKVSTTTNTTGAVTGLTPDQSSTYLQDMTVNLKLAKIIPCLDSVAPKMEMWIGQQKPGITEEGPRPSSNLDFPERSLLARTYADKRDVGLLIKDSHQYVDYTLGLFNDNGMNTPDNNNNKTVAGHVTLKPCSAFKFGASGSTGARGLNEAASTRYGCDAQVVEGPAGLKAEYLQGREGTADFTGYYVQPSCYIVADKLQLIGRYDSYDPNTDVNKNTIQEISGGLNYFFSKHNSKIQLDYIRRNNEAATDEDIVMVCFQAMY